MADHDRQEAMRTAGGTYKPALDGLGAQILSIVDNQFDPRTNTIDDAVDYCSLGNNFLLKFLVVIS